MNELRYLENLPKLKVLNLAENPICSAGVDYRAVVLKYLPNLEKLDDVAVTYQEVEAARNLDLACALFTEDLGGSPSKTPPGKRKEHVSTTFIPN